MMTENPYYTSLPNRGLIRVNGSDASSFLQGLITNDMDALGADNPALYACLLTPQGKFLHDFFISQDDGEFLLECEGGARTQDLYDRLNRYRLRSDVQISYEENTPVYAVFDAEHAPSYADPRHVDMGLRSFKKPDDMEERSFETYDTHRLSLCIPDGSRDMVIESSTLLECGLDTLNGVSFDKGCYVGQEITARMHYRGLLKKRLYAVKGDNLPAFGDDIIAGEKRIGEMRSSCGNTGLALLKDSEVESLENTDIALL